MTFSNIQNVAIRQGPLQRFFGIADVEVRTAGGGGGGSGGGQHENPSAENMHIGYFRGVDNAEEIRDLIMNHLRRLSASGLGDPDEADHEMAARDSAVDEGTLQGATSQGVASPDAMAPVAADAASSRPADAVLVAARDLLHEVRALRFEGSGPMAGR